MRSSAALRPLPRPVNVGAKLQKKARELSAKCGFEVVVWSWHDIANELIARQPLLRRIYHRYWRHPIDPFRLVVL